MDLREIKQEVRSLPNLEKHAQELKANWVRTIRYNSNKHLPFLNELPQEIKFRLNAKIQSAHQCLKNIESAQMIHNKLHTYSRNLIEMKLALMQQNTRKAQVLTNSMIHDEFLNVKQTIQEVKSFDENVKALETHYQEINDLLHKELSLDEALFYMNIPHMKYIKGLIKTAESQKRLTRHIGRHFVSIVKENRKIKKPSS